MIPVVFSLLLGLSPIVVQAQKPDSKPETHSPASGDPSGQQKPVTPEEPVISIQGVCKERSAKTGAPATCQTDVTREQFERLLAALAATGQSVPTNRRRELAQTYATFLAYEQAARTSGTEESAEFRELLNWERLRALADVYRYSLQEKYRNPTAQEIDDYYHANLLGFTDIRLGRILIPRKNFAAKSQEEYEKRALQVAEDLRARAAKGEELGELQKEGYATLGLASTPPTDMGNRRKASLAAEERDEVFALSPGDVSKVEQEPYSFVIYKVESKHLLPEEVVKDEIANEISRQRLDQALKAVLSSIHPEFNPRYFAPRLPPTPPGKQPPASKPTGSEKNPGR